MSVSTGKTASRQQVPVFVVVIMVIALIGFVAWRGWAALAGPAAGKLPPPPVQEINFINGKAMECKGDFTKLNADDQAKVQSISRGFGPASMASTYRRLSKPKE